MQTSHFSLSRSNNKELASRKVSPSAHDKDFLVLQNLISFLLQKSQREKNYEALERFYI